MTAREILLDYGVLGVDDCLKDLEALVPKKKEETSRCDITNDFNWGFNRAIAEMHKIFKA